MPEHYFWSYTLIPLSSIMFPHMAIMCFSARKVTAFKRTVVLYPLAIMAIWLPCVFLGVLGTVTLTGKMIRMACCCTCSTRMLRPGWREFSARESFRRSWARMRTRCWR